MKRIAVVTGGTRGLGEAISRELKQRGCEVISIYHSNEVAADEFSASTAIPTRRCDVADLHACQALVEEIQAQFGPVNILVNNAGITSDAVFHRMTSEQWWHVIQTNLGSVFNMARCVIESMREQKFGRIVNISSINGLKGQFGQANYSASKAAILGFTKSLALENASKNITVNAIAPGYCDTDMVAAVPVDVLQKIIAGIPVGRLGTADDVARMVAFLVDDKAGYITGATFSVNGGQFMG
ncbi:acetoacetyl-CoA reductase [Noviherbaspirillum malthae]|uniref:acetoacetyl-CoA reductase n=1 Tax=Noviherbaspirillum malthae TaxID=1260987 RepID=UPI00188E57AF|nr:acetoacetyl-CoA reductase [Noviherbaspirillum malthae]